MRAPTTVLALLLSGGLLVGCSAGGSDDSATAASAEGGVQDAGAPGGADSDGGGTMATDFRIAPGDAVIRTADLSVRVDDVAKAADEAARLARGAGGRVESEDRSGDGSGGSASVQLRVPPAEFDATVAALVALGDERSRQLGSEDVGEQVADLDARLATQRASVARVQALLAEATTLGEVVQIESELTKRTADLEALQARLAALEARVDLSTIVVRFDAEGGPVVGDALGFGDGLEAGWSALSSSGRVLAVTAGALLPFLPLVALSAWLLLRSRRRAADHGVVAQS